MRDNSAGNRICQSWVAGATIVPAKDNTNTTNVSATMRVTVFGYLLLIGSKTIVSPGRYLSANFQSKDDNFVFQLSGCWAAVVLSFDFELDGFDVTFLFLARVGPWIPRGKIALPVERVFGVAWLRVEGIFNLGLHRFILYERTWYLPGSEPILFHETTRHNQS